METIVVPAPPKSAFNKNRRASDLILHQLRHFQHVAEKSGMRIDPALEREIATEGGAARYIATVTREMRAQAAGATPGPRLVASAPAAAKPAPGKLDLAAAAEPEDKPAKNARNSGGKKTPGGGKRKR